jgi:hypothetical protein
MTAWTAWKARAGVIRARRDLQSAIDRLTDALPGGSSPAECAAYSALFDGVCELASAAKTIDAALRRDELWGEAKGGAR